MKNGSKWGGTPQTHRNKRNYASIHGNAGGLKNRSKRPYSVKGNSTRTRRPDGGARPFAPPFSSQHLISNQAANARKPCNINALGHTMPGQVPNTSPPSHRHAITRTAQRRGRVHSKRNAQRMKRPPNPCVACSLRLGRNPFVAHRVQWYPSGHATQPQPAARHMASLKPYPDNHIHEDRPNDNAGQLGPQQPAAPCLISPVLHMRLPQYPYGVRSLNRRHAPATWSTTTHTAIPTNPIDTNSAKISATPRQP